MVMAGTLLQGVLPLSSAATGPVPLTTAGWIPVH